MQVSEELEPLKHLMPKSMAAN